MRPRAEPRRFLRFGPLPQPVRFKGCADLLAAIRSILRGWDVREVDPANAPRSVVRVCRSRKGYRRVSCWMHKPSLVREETQRHIVHALCSFHFELLEWYVATHPTTLFIHGAAVEFGRRLAVFPALAKAGKSTLTVRLAMAGHRVFCDDVLPIDTKSARGVAIGMVPRLRPPLPVGAGAPYRRFVHARKGYGYLNRQYVNLKPSELARYGEQAKVGAIVLLNRHKTGPASIRRLDPAEAMEKIVLQNFAREVPTPLILDTLARVVDGAECYRLRYAKMDDAADVLDATLGAAKAKRPIRAKARRR